MAFIIFDIDGTLLETERVTVPAVQRTFVAHGLPTPDAEAICSFFGKPVQEYHVWLKAQCGGLDAAQIVAETDKLELELIGSEGCLYPGTRETLDALLAAGHTLAVCSNAPDDYMAEFLDSHDMRRYFAEVRCRGTRYPGKDEMIAELVGLIPVRPAIVVGDRHDDVTAAHANGALAVAATYGFGADHETQDADGAIETLTELPRLVEEFVRTVD